MNVYNSQSKYMSWVKHIAYVASMLEAVANLIDFKKKEGRDGVIAFDGNEISSLIRPGVVAHFKGVYLW